LKASKKKGKKKIIRAETNETENRKIKSTKGWLFQKDQ